MSNSTMNTLRIQSKSTCNEIGSGSLVVNGGCSIGKNLKVTEEIDANELIVKGGCVVGDIFIKGNVKMDNIFISDDKNNVLKFNKSIVPNDKDNSDTIISLGDKGNFWDHLYVRNIKVETIKGLNLDIVHNVSMGTNRNDESLVNIISNHFLMNLAILNLELVESSLKSSALWSLLTEISSDSSKNTLLTVIAPFFSAVSCVS